MIPNLGFYLKINHKVALTITGIMIAVMFISSTVIITKSFESSNEYLLSKFKSKYYVVYSHDILNGTVSDVEPISVKCIIVPVEVNNTSTYFVGLYDPYNLLEKNYNFAGNDTWAGYLLHLKRGYWSVSSYKETNSSVYISRSFSSVMFPDNWLLGNLSVARNLSGINSGYSFLIIPEYREYTGYTTASMVSILSYFVASSEEVGLDLIMLEFVSLIIITVLVNTIMWIEVKENEKNIAIMRSIGSKNSQILYIFMLRGVFITLFGVVFGIFLGVIMSYTVSTVVEAVGFNALFLIEIPYTAYLIPLVIGLIGSIAGAVYPIHNVLKIEPAKVLKG